MSEFQVPRSISMNYYHLSKYIRLAKKIKVEWYLRTTLLRLVENNNAIR